MSPVIKNLAMVLGLITVAFAGYYIYVNKDSVILDSQSSAGAAATLAQSQKFIQYRQQLDTIRLDMSTFENPHYLVLKSFSTPVEDQPFGRTNPFTATIERIESDSADSETASDTIEN